MHSSINAIVEHAFRWSPPIRTRVLNPPYPEVLNHSNDSPRDVTTIVTAQDVYIHGMSPKPIPYPKPSLRSLRQVSLAAHKRSNTETRSPSIPRSLVVLVQNVHADGRVAVAWSHFIMRPRLCLLASRGGDAGSGAAGVTYLPNFWQGTVTRSLSDSLSHETDYSPKHAKGYHKPCQWQW